LGAHPVISATDAVSITKQKTIADKRIDIFPLYSKNTIAFAYQCASFYNKIYLAGAFSG
jgi:hypothetical protein